MWATWCLATRLLQRVLLAIEQTNEHISSTTLLSYTLVVSLVYWLDSKGEYIMQHFSAIVLPDQRDMSRSLEASISILQHRSAKATVSRAVPT